MRAGLGRRGGREGQAAGFSCSGSGLSSNAVASSAAWHLSQLSMACWSTRGRLAKPALGSPLRVGVGATSDSAQWYQRSDDHP